MANRVGALAEWLAAALNVPVVWVNAIGVALAGIAAAVAFHLLVSRVLVPVARRTPGDADEAIFENVDRPGAWSIAFLGVVAAARVLWSDPVQDETFRRITITGFLLIWGAALARGLSVVLRRATHRLYGGATERSAVTLLTRLVKVAVAAVIVLTVFTVWDVDVTPLIASAGLIGIALALAAQDTLANFFAGIAIYVDRPYKIGDWVVLDQGQEGEVRGQVFDVGLRSTRLLTRDDVLVTVPNSIIANARLVNESGHVPRFRVSVRVGVAYESDLDHVERVLTRIAESHPRVLGEPPPRARVRGFGESSVDWDLLAWIRDPEHRGLVVHELALAMHRRFREEGIRIPFPQRDVHMDPRTVPVTTATEDAP